MDFEILKSALADAAERAGVREYEIYACVSESISAETLKDEISSFSSGVGGGICFRCIVDGRMGYASSEESDPAAMEMLVERAISNAKCIDSTDEVFIFKGSEKYEEVDNGPLDLLDAQTVRENALRLQKDVYAQSDRVTDGTQSAVFSEVMSVYLYNSYGLSLSNRTGMSGAYAAAVVRDGEEAQEAFDFSVGTSFGSPFNHKQVAFLAWFPYSYG